MLVNRLRKRLAKEESGFTLIELLIVLVIIGILLAIAVPSYLGFKDRANNTASKANVRTAVPAVEAYYADHGDYAFDLDPLGAAVSPAGTAALVLIDQGVTLTTAKGTNSNASYCIDANVGGKIWNKAGPAATIAAGACP
jgi:prepilin-type N-terminal cleavage/methylation domain-containing protein